MDKKDGNGRLVREKVREGAVTRGENDEKSGQNDERLERIAIPGSHVIRDGIKITANDTVCGTDVGLYRSLTASFASALEKIFTVSSKKSCPTCARGSRGIV